MAVRITKPAFNLRDKVSELDRPVGAIGTQILKSNTLTEFARAAHTGRRNFVRNGAMEVWQRGTSAFNNIYNYTADRWQATRYAGTVNQITRNEINQRIADEYGFNWYLRYGFSTGGGGAAYLNQPLESADSKKMRGKPVCFSFYAKTTSQHAGKRFKAAISWHTDTSHNDNGMYYFNFKNASTSSMELEFYPSELWNRYWVTTNIPYNIEQIGVALIAHDYDEGGFDVTGCQLEIGNSPTPFEHLPYAEELALCQRYYQQIGPASSSARVLFGAGNGNARIRGMQQLVPEMRVAPTVAHNTSSESPSFYSFAGGAPSYTSVNGVSSTTKNFTWDFNTSTHNQAGEAFDVKGSGAFITLSAEL